MYNRILQILCQKILYTTRMYDLHTRSDQILHTCCIIYYFGMLTQAALHKPLFVRKFSLPIHKLNRILYKLLLNMLNGICCSSN